MAASGTKARLLLNGAYGYTGRLTAEFAAARKLDVHGGRLYARLT